LLERKAKADMKRRLAPMHKALPVEPTPNTVDLNALALRATPEARAVPKQAESLQGDMQSPTLHIVKPGETLYRISRQHGVTVDKVRKWNKLPDDIIEVGQKLIVGQE
jgi:LysM repeat protein